MDKLLLDASNRRLNIENTCILDVRSLRPQCVKREESEQESQQNDRITLQCFGEMAAHMQPDVILICQCTEQETNLFSRMDRAGTSEVRDVAGRPTQIVYGFHPSVYLNRGYLKGFWNLRRPQTMTFEAAGYLLQCLLHLSFHVAVNALARRAVEGDGLTRLHNAVFGRQLEHSISSRSSIGMAGPSRLTMVRNETTSTLRQYSAESPLSEPSSSRHEVIILDD